MNVGNIDASVISGWEQAKSLAEHLDMRLVSGYDFIVIAPDETLRKELGLVDDATFARVYSAVEALRWMQGWAQHSEFLKLSGKPLKKVLHAYPVHTIHICL